MRREVFNHLVLNVTGKDISLLSESEKIAVPEHAYEIAQAVMQQADTGHKEVWCDKMGDFLDVSNLPDEMEIIRAIETNQSLRDILKACL